MRRQVQESAATYAEVSSPSMARGSFDIEENKCYGCLKVAPQKNASSYISDGNKTVTMIASCNIMLLNLGKYASKVCLLIELDPFLFN